MAMQRKKKANLRDVARAAEVSVATVSRVLNAPEVVQKTTRQRVERAIAELGFHPSPAARAVNSGRTKIVGALIPTLENDIFAQTIEAIETRLGDFGYSLVVATTGEDPQKEVRRATELLNLGVEGLYLPGAAHSPELMALLEQRRVPAVVISYYDPDLSHPTIGYDNRAAAKLALNHLLDLGHRRIAVVHGPLAQNDRMAERLRGAEDQRPEVQLSRFETALTAEGGATVVAQLLAGGTKPDAILCLSDVIAIGVLFEVQRRGLGIPEDLAVMGVHDLPISRSVHPRLSTVRLPARRMGTRAAVALATWLDEGRRPAPYCYEATLVRRETT